MPHIQNSSIDPSDPASNIFKKWLCPTKIMSVAPAVHSHIGSRIGKMACRGAKDCPISAADDASIIETVFLQQFLLSRPCVAAGRALAIKLMLKCVLWKGGENFRVPYRLS